MDGWSKLQLVQVGYVRMLTMGMLIFHDPLHIVGNIRVAAVTVTDT